jgi:Anti-sigma-K factor rskA
MIPIVAGAPLRFTEQSDVPLDEVASRLQALEQRLLDASAHRIHDFERRLEHEWLALRQLHEEPLKALEHRTTAITETSLILVRETLALLRAQAQHGADTARDEAEPSDTRVVDRRSRAMTIAMLAAVVVLAMFTAYTRWSLGNEVRDSEARAVSAERQVAALQRTVQTQTRNTEETVQRLTADALTSAVRAQRLANVLAASDVRVFPLLGLRTAAAANGRIFFSASRGVVASLSRLPPPATNQVYQVWLVTSGGSISLGFAAPDAQGRIDAAFDTPSELVGNVNGFMLSLEPTGGNAKPTGPIVIAS